MAKCECCGRTVIHKMSCVYGPRHKTKITLPVTTKHRRAVFKPHATLSASVLRVAGEVDILRPITAPWEADDDAGPLWLVRNVANGATTTAYDDELRAIGD